MNGDVLVPSPRQLDHQTTERDSIEKTLNSIEIPGVVVVYTNNQPVLQAYPLRDSGIRVGRGGCDISIDDSLLSRRHAEFVHAGHEWVVRDLDSLNGLYVNGTRVAPSSPGGEAVVRGIKDRSVVRVGRTLILLCNDVAQLLHGSMETTDDYVFGPRLQAVMREIEEVGHASESLHISGPSGAGKELAARRYHASSPRCNGPFVALNCAAVPDGLAERLLFGTVKGAYSGADTDAQGYIQAAHGGTLFLDEIAELDLAVQAKLLRVLETREAIPLGATKAVPVDILLCSATHRNLREAVAANEFRSDLYFRVAQPEVQLPPLRNRRTEIPHLVVKELKKLNLEPNPLLIEACLIRDWPGNVRELRREVAHAGRRALTAGVTEVPHRMLSAAAGVRFQKRERLPTEAPAPRVPAPRRKTRPKKETILAVLNREGWNVSASARALGVHRTQLCRWMRRLEIQRPPDE